MAGVIDGVALKLTTSFLAAFGAQAGVEVIAGLHDMAVRMRDRWQNEEGAVWPQLSQAQVSNRC
jgi:hypothetical protein